MVGLVISDSFLLTGRWKKSEVGVTLQAVEKISFNEPITSFLHDEAELNSILASALRKAKEIHSFDGVDVKLSYLLDMNNTEYLIETEAASLFYMNHRNEPYAHDIVKKEIEEFLVKFQSKHTI